MTIINVIRLIGGTGGATDFAVFSLPAIAFALRS